jgi:hypothetical protein
MLSQRKTGSSSEILIPRELEKSIYPLKPTPVFCTYWYFAAERQKILELRAANLASPWSEDFIFQTYRFTNAYRVADRASQYLLKEVLYNGVNHSSADIFLRCILYKIFNKPETWDWLVQNLGDPSSKNFDPSRYSQALSHLKRRTAIFSPAYIMPSGKLGAKSYPSKHEFYLNLVRLMIDDNLHEALRSASSLQNVYQLLKRYPSLGPFLAFQFSIDLNYSTLIDFPESSFVVAGPGAISGIEKCFLNSKVMPYEEIIRKTAEIQELAFNVLKLSFRPLHGRPLQLIDCQNLFCETDKYSRVKHPEYQSGSGRTRIKRKFFPKLGTPSIFLPPKWSRIEQV